MTISIVEDKYSGREVDSRPCTYYECTYICARVCMCVDICAYINKLLNACMTVIQKSLCYNKSKVPKTVIIAATKTDKIEIELHSKQFTK